MKPYVESGRRASRRISQPRAGAELHCMQRLRGFKQVINLLCGVALVSVPMAGFASGSPRLAVVVGLLFLLLIWMLEIGERSAKRELAARRGSTPPSLRSEE